MSIWGMITTDPSCRRDFTFTDMPFADQGLWVSRSFVWDDWQDQRRPHCTICLDENLQWNDHGTVYICLERETDCNFILVLLTSMSSLLRTWSVWLREGTSTSVRHKGTRSIMNNLKPIRNWADLEQYEVRRCFPTVMKTLSVTNSLERPCQA